MTLRKYIGQRLLIAAPVLLGLVTMIFVISRIIPGDPARLFLGPDATDAQVAALDKAWGLNQPVWVQYYLFIVDLLHGDLGNSLHFEQPVVTLIEHFFPATLELTSAAMIIALLAGVPLGILAATHRNRFGDNFSRVLSLIGVSIPEFWSGILYQVVAFALVGTVVIGRWSTGVPPPHTVTGLYVIDSILAGSPKELEITLVHLLPPALILSLGSLAQVTRMLRSRMIDVSTENYITVAAANGMPKDLLTYKYMLKNAFTSTLSVIGLTYGFLLGGDFVVESVFGWPGMGWAAVQGILFKDVNLVVGITLVVGVGFFVINTIVDLLYSYFDPRVRYG